MKQRIQQCGRWLHDALASLAGLAIGLGFLWGWRHRRRWFEREWVRVAGEESEEGAEAHA